MKRRKQAQSISELQAGMERIQAEGQGVWQLSIYGPEAVLALLHNSFVGDADATRTMTAIARLIAGIHEVASTPKPMLCLLCDTKFGRRSMPLAWVLLHARRDDPSQAVGNGICAACYKKYPSAEALSPPVIALYKAKMITDLRLLPPIGPPGHA
jgi:hypothetical protein